VSGNFFQISFAFKFLFLYHRHQSTNKDWLIVSCRAVAWHHP